VDLRKRIGFSLDPPALRFVISGQASVDCSVPTDPTPQQPF
jgi:hypothetical protein